MGTVVCEILLEDLDAGPGTSAESRRSQSRVSALFGLRMRPRLLIVSPALMGIDQPVLDTGLATELNDQGFVVLSVSRFKKIVGHVVHRLNVALMGDEIVVRDQRIPAAAGSPLAFHLPLPVGGWAIYETAQTLTLRYAACGFVSWPVRTPTEVETMMQAIEKLTSQRPQQIHHAGPVSRQTEQIGQLFSRPVLFGTLTKFADLRLELFTRRGWTGAASDGLTVSNRLWGSGIGWGHRFIRSGIGISAIVFFAALSATFGLRFSQPESIAQSEVRTTARLGESGSPYWELANTVSDDIRRAGIAQIQELRIRIDEIKSSQKFAVSIRWITTPSPLLRTTDQKSISVIQTQLQQLLSKMSGVESVEIDLAKNTLAAKLHPAVSAAESGIPDLSQWMGSLKKTHAVLIETKNQSGHRLSFQAPDQPIGNLVSFATALSRNPQIREITLRAGSPGIGSLEFEMEPHR